MRKILLALLLASITIYPSTAFAAVSSPTPTIDAGKTASASSQSAAIDQQINKLKDQIASRVAQLKLVEKRAIIGTVTENTNNQITITDTQDNTRYVDVDELTKFNNPNTKGTFGISDMTKGTFIGVLGLYNKESKKILARFIDVVSFPKYTSGIIASIDKVNYLIHVTTADTADIPVDIENVTKQYIYTKAGGVQKSGFSKMKEGERVTIIGFPNAKDKSHIIASRIILFPEIPVNPKISLPKPTEGSASITLTPSTGSGKKIYPLQQK